MVAPYEGETMSTIGAILALILGILFLTVWSVNVIFTILGWILVIAAVVWLIRYLTASRT